MSELFHVSVQPANPALFTELLNFLSTYYVSPLPHHHSREQNMDSFLYAAYFLGGDGWRKDENRI